MTSEEYGQAYQNGFNLTIRFLLSRGLASDSAQELAQAAWVKGWERLGQLRNPSMVTTWMNSIAVNMHRSEFRRREASFQTFDEMPAASTINLAGLDVHRILGTCKDTERSVLRQHYLEGLNFQEIAEQQGSTEAAVRIRLYRARHNACKRLGGK